MAKINSTTATVGTVRTKLPEVLASLSLATDLANGNPLETTLRICSLGMRMGLRMGLSKQQFADLYFASILRFIGCTAYAHEESEAFGDDIALRRLYAPVDSTSVRSIMGPTMRGLGKGGNRARAILNMILRSGKIFQGLASANCEIASRLADRLGMEKGVIRILSEIHERWDGKGAPGRLKGDQLSVPVRILHLAYVAEILRQSQGLEESITIIRSRSGRQFDPAAVKAFKDVVNEDLNKDEEESVWDSVISMAPDVANRQTTGLAEAALAFADFVDLKSSFTAGHSRAVSDLATAAAATMNLSAPEIESLKIAGLLHDLGMVSVPTSVLEKPGRLNTSEWERVRLHPYYTDRILARSPVFENIRTLASSHHEKMDGSGYHRGAAGSSLTIAARILAASESYQGMIEHRSYREAIPKTRAAQILNDEVRSGKLDGEAVHALLASTGQANAPVSGLSEREVQVLRLLSRGYSNKEIGVQLKISYRTVQHHTIHIYDKIGVSTRAGATLYAAERGLANSSPKNLNED